VNQDGLKLNGTHQLLAYVDDVNILGGSAHAVKENAEALVVATKEIGLEVNADKTKYMVMSRDQNAGRSYSWEDNIKMDRQEVGGSCGDWMELAHDRDSWRLLVSTVRNLRVPKMRGIS
jgi:GTP-dependent phosphoenolpyruvate carboxykinase